MLNSVRKDSPGESYADVNDTHVASHEFAAPKIISLSLPHRFSDPGHFNNKLLAAICNDQFQMPN